MFNVEPSEGTLRADSISEGPPGVTSCPFIPATDSYEGGASVGASVVFPDNSWVDIESMLDDQPSRGTESEGGPEYDAGGAAYESSAPLIILCGAAHSIYLKLARFLFLAITTMMHITVTTTAQAITVGSMTAMEAEIKRIQ